MAGYEERLCTECGTEFKPYQYNQKRCRSCVLKFDRRAEHRVLTKKCPSCEEVFMPRTARQVYCSSHCGEEGRVKNYYLRTYGLEREEVETLLRNCDYKCQICGGEGFIMNGSRHKAKLVVDHDHKTGKVRGMLCHNCNRALGLLADSVENMQRAIDYLSK